MAVARVSILTIPPEHLERAAQRMDDAQAELEGIRALPGLLAYFAGVDRSAAQLVNVSFWADEASAQQMSTFRPMLDLAAEFVAFGATFLRPVPNFDLLWQWGDVAPLPPA